MTRQKQEEELSLLLHPVRRRIYSMVCERPGAYFFKLANNLNLPQGTLNWHIKRLEEDGLIGSFKFGGRRIYYPIGMRSEEVEKALYALQVENTRKVFLYVLNNPGCFQLQISRDTGLHHDTVRYHLDRLKEVELVELVRDGRKVRVYPGKNAKKIMDESTRIITDTYVNFLMEKLRDGCVYPEIIEKTQDRLIIRVECPEAEDIILTLQLAEWDFLEDIYDTEHEEEN